MSSAKLPLNVALDILDRADAVAPTESKPDDLVQAMLDLRTGHTLATINQAVEDHLANAAPVMPPSTTPFAFKWHRPTAIPQVDQAEQRRQRRQKGTLAVGVMLACGLIGLVGFGYLAFFTSEGGQGNWFEHAMAALIAGVIICMAGIIPACALEALWGIRQDRQDWATRVVVDPKELAGFFKARACRNYLRAMRQSAVPVFLEGDVLALRALAKQAQARQEAQHRDKLAAQRQADQARQLAAAAL